MRTYLLDIIPKIKRFSQKLDDLTILTNQHWVVIDEETDRKLVFIFREKDNQLLISGNGKIEKGRWEYLGNNSILIDRKDGSFLFKHGFIDDYILALKIDGKDEYALLVNEIKFEERINSIPSVLNFLEKRYLNHSNKKILKPKTKKELVITKTQVTRNPIIDFKKPFNIDDFANLKKDINTISNNLSQINKNYAVDIIISFTRDHTIKSEWIKSNPTVNNLVTKKKIPLNLMEYMFKESSNYPGFRNDFENYIKEQLK
jgi:hypothetical protein|tara:strand:- start:190 stop:966 length:777 start_codon:yes stop_codon:yes gene_type:complete